MGEEWFKLEVLQNYSAKDDSPSLRSWLRGDKHKSIEQMNAADNREWISSCQEKLRHGIKLIRVHVVEKPYSPYIEWELEHYRYVNVAKCGEAVYLLDKAQAADLELPAGDLMIFDNSRAVLNEYQNGRMVQETFYDQGDDILRFLELRKTMMERAKKL